MNDQAIKEKKDKLQEIFWSHLSTIREIREGEPNVPIQAIRKENIPAVIEAINAIYLKQLEGLEEVIRVNLPIGKEWAKDVADAIRKMMGEEKGDKH